MASSNKGKAANPYMRTRSRQAPRRRGGLAEEIAGHVRELILTGQLRPGGKIDQDALGQALDVSRSPIREALVVLGTEGLLDITPRRGAFVARLTRADIVDHYELMGLISGRIAAMAAATLTDDQITELRAIHERFCSAPDGAHAQLNDEFHAQINQVAPARTKWLVRHMEQSIPSDYFEFVSGWDQAAATGHEEIVVAIEGRDEQAARDAMERHLHDAGTAAADALLAVGFWSEDPATSANDVKETQQVNEQ